MTRGVRDRAAEPAVVTDEDDYPLITRPTGKHRDKSAVCGFCGPTCSAKSHELCPGSVRNGAQCPVRIWVCACFQENPGAHPRARMLS